MVIALPFRGLRPRRWEPVGHLQPRSAGFEQALASAEADVRARLADERLALDTAPSATAFWVDDRVDGVDHHTAGILVGLRVDARGGDAVLAHERTFPGPVHRRVVTRNRLGIEPTPTLVVLRDPVPALATLLDEARSAARSATSDLLVAEAAGGRHHALPCDLPDDVTRALRGVPALVADGHHRIAAACHPEARDRGTILAWLVAAERAPRLHPVHRIVASLPVDAERLLLDAGVRVDPVEGLADGRVVPDGRAPVLVTRQGAWHLSVESGGRAAALLGELHPTVRNLPVALVQVVLGDVLGIGTRREEMGTTIDADLACSDVAGGAADAAVLACGPRLEDVWRAAEAGVLLPAKATWFAPKPYAGAVMRPLGDADSEAVT